MKCFVIAMESEANPIIDAMRVFEGRKVGNKHIVRGQLFDRDVAVLVCGVGKVNAACGTQYAIDKLEADEIINIGVAGGLNDGLKVGKVYSISQAVQYDFDLTQLNGTKIGTLDECKDNYLPLLKSRLYPLKNLATGDRFNDSKTDYLLLTQELNADIRDMECGAVAQVCMHSAVPLRSYKIISDLAGSGSTTEQYLKNLTECFDTLKSELKNIAEEIYG